MKKIAIVVQRCHESIVGGSEALAWQYATLLRDVYEVEVLTTTAVDAAYWANALPVGTEKREGVTIRRFHVDIGYSPYRSSLFERLLSDFETSGAGRDRARGLTRHIPWSIPLQEEFIRRIGPYSDSLVRFIKERWTHYHAVLFITYLYPTAYFGLLEVARGRTLFAPTLHDEQPAYLSAYGHAARRAGLIVWLSEGERRLGSDLWGEMAGRVVGASIDTRLREPAPSNEPYLLYCGRIDPNKGCRELFEYFTRFKEQNPSPLRLVLTGKDDIPVPDHPDIDFRGFVSAEEKFRLMAGADIFSMPSGKESFSIVTLEAMAQRTPVLASGVCEVIADHIEESGAGMTYRDYESFASGLSGMLSNKAGLLEMGSRGRDYVVTRFQTETIRSSLIEAIEACVSASKSESRAQALASSARARVSSILSPDDNGEQKMQPLWASLPEGFFPPLPLPAGWTEPALRELVTSIRVEDAPPEEMRIYAESDFKRFVYTLGLVPDRSGLSLLELGANPYFTTTLLHKFRDAHLHLANFFGQNAQEGTQRVTIHRTGEEISYAYKHFNIEEDIFPYEDRSFDLVLFCEIIEHLLLDPVHALLEIRRVLKPDGQLIITTPNVVRLDNVRKTVAGENVYDPYSGYGPYGRHNREYTVEELSQLLFSNGFDVRTLFTADVNPGHTSCSVSLESVLPLVRHRQPEWGQYIFCLSSLRPGARAMKPARPDWLYRSMPEQNEAKLKS